MIGEAFRIRRKRRGLNVHEVREQMGISLHLLNRYEDGNLHYTRNNVKAALDYLNRQWTLETYYGIKCYGICRCQ